LDDPRLAPFRNLPQRKSGRGSRCEHFIAEGRLVVERLLSSPYRCESILVAANKRAHFQELLAERSEQRPGEANPQFLVLPDDLISELVGFPFHSGVLACGVRAPQPTVLAQAVEGWFRPLSPPLPETESCAPMRTWPQPIQKSLGSGSSDILGRSTCESGQGTARRETLIALPTMDSGENLGSIIRSAYGLGMTGLLLPEGSADPLARRVVRVSMGHVLSFPFHCSPDLPADLLRLQQVGFQLIGCEVHSDMIPLRMAKAGPRQVLVFGHEFAGLGDEFLTQMDQIVGIRMANAVDSLNVAVAAAIVMHHFADPS